MVFHSHVAIDRRSVARVRAGHGLTSHDIRTHGENAGMSEQAVSSEHDAWAVMGAGAGAAVGGTSFAVRAAGPDDEDDAVDAEDLDDDDLDDEDLDDDDDDDDDDLDEFEDDELDDDEDDDDEADEIDFTEDRYGRIPGEDEADV